MYKRQAQSSSAPAVQAQPPSSQAQPEPVAYTVAFDSRGGSAVEALQNVTQGARIAEPSSPVREGYTLSLIHICILLACGPGARRFYQ